MGALEAILGLGALLGIGYYVIQMANASGSGMRPPITAAAPAPAPQIQYIPSSTPTPSAPAPTTPTPTLKPKPAASKKPAPAAAKKEILTPTTSEATSPNVAGTAFTFNVVGDLDDNALAAATATNLCGTPPTIVLIIGDFAYHNDAQKWWTGSMKTCNGKNVVGSVGNHDNSGKGFLELFPANGGKWEYTKKIGNIAIIAVNTGYCSAQCMDLKSESLFQAAQADASVKWIIVHFHKPVFTKGTGADAPMSLHNMMKKYPKVKMAFAGHNHSYKRYIPQDGIQYITAGAGGHDKSSSTAVKKGFESGSVGVVKCRVAQNGSITCQYVANSGEILDSWGLTADGKHTGTGGVVPDQSTGGGTGPGSESGYAQAFYASLNPYDYQDKEEMDNAVLAMMDEYDTIMHPRRKFNNKIYHYSRYTNGRY